MITLATAAMRARKISQGLMAAGVLAVAAFLALYFPNRDDTSGAIVGAALAFCAGAIGFAAVGRARPLPRRSLREHARLIALSLSIGSALGVANLIANYGIASLDSRIYVQMSEQYAQFSAWSGVFASPLLEEIWLRLFLMGGIAWLLTRSTDDRRTVFLVALTVSALVFALLHLLRPTTGVLHATGVVLKNRSCGAVARLDFLAVGAAVLYCVPWHDECDPSRSDAGVLLIPVDVCGL